MAAATEQQGASVSDVLVAAELGWRMAELYAAVKPAQLLPPVPPPDGPPPAVSAQRDDGRVQLPSDLPGVGALRRSQQLTLLFDQVSVGLGQLRPLITGAGLTAPSNEDWSVLASDRHSAEGRYQLARAVAEFHTDLISALTACGHQVGRAYGVGRAVADLCLRPDSSDATTFTSEFMPGGRVATIRSWLQQLHTSLPPHAAGAVSGSIAQWQQWASQPVWNGQPLDWAVHGGEIVSALETQGRQWRLLLTGQAAPLDALSAEDYVQAAGFLVGRVRRIGQRLLLQYWPWAAGLTALMAAAVGASAALLHSPAAKGVGVAISVLAWLGITGRSLSAALGRTVSHVEQSLWEAELDLAAAWANTKLPVADRDRKLDEARAPALRLGRGSQPPKESPVPMPRKGPLAPKPPTAQPAPKPPG